MAQSTLSNRQLPEDELLWCPPAKESGFLQPSKPGDNPAAQFMCHGFSVDWTGHPSSMQVELDAPLLFMGNLPLQYLLAEYVERPCNGVLIPAGSKGERKFFLLVAPAYGVKLGVTVRQTDTGLVVSATVLSGYRTAAADVFYGLFELLGVQIPPLLRGCYARLRAGAKAQHQDELLKSILELEKCSGRVQTLNALMHNMTERAKSTPDDCPVQWSQELAEVHAALDGLHALMRNMTERTERAKSNPDNCPVQ